MNVFMPLLMFMNNVTQSLRELMEFISQTTPKGPASLIILFNNQWADATFWFGYP